MKNDRLRKITIGDLLDETAEKFPVREAVVFSELNLRYSWRQLQEICNKVAKGFMKIGIKKGDHVAVWAHNRPEWLFSQIAAAKIGAILVPVNPANRARDTQYVLENSDAKTLIIQESFKTSDYVTMIESICPEIKQAEPGKLNSAKLPELKNIILIGNEKKPGMFSFQEIIEMGEEISDKEFKKIQKSCKPKEVSIIQYTSGTTGFPKGAMLSHFGMVNNAIQMAERMRLTAEDKICLPVPFYHIFGTVVGNLISLATGAALIVPSEFFNPLKTIKAIEKERCTAVYGVPTMFIAQLNHAEFKRTDLSSLRTGVMAGAPCSIELMKEVIHKMGVREMTIAYGLTEASPIITFSRWDDPEEIRLSTVGSALPGIKVRIVDPKTGKKVSPGVQGEIQTKGYLVMKGYYKMPEKTKETIDKKGWLKTGDLAVVDKRGYYKITGRLKDLIIRGGENIDPREIEELIFSHPKIFDVQVVGVPDKETGEEVAACVKLKENEALTEEEVKDFCKGKIAHFKIPKYVKFVKEFPMTVTGKIKKNVLREILIKELGLEEAARIKTA